MVTNYLYAVLLIVTVVAILRYFNYQVAFSIKIKIFINIIILISTASLLLYIFGKLWIVVGTI